MKNKIIRFCLGVLAGIGIAALLFRPDFFQKETPAIQGEFQIEVNVPKRDTTCYGNDIENLSREEVQALDEQRKPAVTFEKEEIKEAVYYAHSLLPGSLKEGIPLNEINLIHESDDPLMFYAQGNTPGQILASDSGTDPVYYALCAFGNQVAVLTGVTSTSSFKVAFEKEFGGQWNTQYCRSEKEMFGCVFADIVLGGYADKWNKLHAPLTRGIVLETIGDFEVLTKQRVSKITAKYAFEDYEHLMSESSLSEEERTELILSQFDPWLEELIKKTGLTFEMVDNFDGLIELPDGRIALGCFVPPSCERSNPTIKLLKGNPHHETTVLHELAHFLDWYSGYEHREAFVNICRQEFDNALWAKEGYKAYNSENNAEYFADAFSFCFVKCGELNSYWKQYCPASYKYMSNLVTKFNSTERGD